MSTTPTPPRNMAFALYIFGTLTYLAWRALWTINWDAPVYSWTFLILETYASVCSMAFYAVIRERRPTVAPPPTRGHSVDVFICTYNEAPAILRQTVRRALALHHPHETWLCDDGNREEVRALADELGCRYLARGDNSHFKAGNLNHALKHSKGELVMVLDADHLVRPEFLNRVIGYFADRRVALVQTPQVFYNVDSFQHHFGAAERRLWHEGAIFHHAMQPGANRWNAAFFVGTGAVLRRSALEEIGGFALGSVTEDAFTSMRLHAAGYRSAYHDEPLGYLLAPQSLHQYLVQRLRWGQGSMQILRMENPLFKPGLSWRQRLVYFMALSSFAQAIVHLAYYTAPALFLLGGPAPLRADRITDFLPLVGHILLDVLMFRLFLGALARPLLAECYKFLNVYAYLKALAGVFKKGRLKFEVTTKGRDAGASLRLLAPQVGLLLLNATGFTFGILRLLGPGTVVDKLGMMVATTFAGLFVVVGAMATVFARERLASSGDFAFPDHIEARLQQQDGWLDAVVVRANETELRVVVPSSANLPASKEVRVSMALRPGAPPLELQGRLVSQELMSAEPGDPASKQVLHLELPPVTAAVADQLFDRLVLHAMPRLIDPLVHHWNGHRVEPALTVAGTGSEYYLRIESNVL